MTTSSATSRMPASGIVRPVERADNLAVAAIIRAVLTEFRCTGPGFAIHDPEVDRIYETYNLPRSAYFVSEHDGVVAGGGGIAPLKGGNSDTCELQKYYILPKYRGFGYGGILLEQCLQAATAHGFRRCYLETLEHMNKAVSIYLRAGFVAIDGPMGNTGHHACTCWYIKEL